MCRIYTVDDLAPAPIVLRHVSDARTDYVLPLVPSGDATDLWFSTLLDSCWRFWANHHLLDVTGGSGSMHPGLAVSGAATASPLTSLIFRLGHGSALASITRSTPSGFLVEISCDEKGVEVDGV